MSQQSNLAIDTDKNYLVNRPLDNAMQNLIVDIRISAEEYIKQYQMPSAVVVTHSRDGRSIRFPANILRPYVLRDGVKGSFCISFDQQGKFSAIEKL